MPWGKNPKSGPEMTSTRKDLITSGIMMLMH